ncbi:MAG: HAMP domain-containing protein [SAR324 cluster bacterium]|nr:HAMP domain-containing protein [SAR324 cluster bacterium]
MTSKIGVKLILAVGSAIMASITIFSFMVINAQREQLLAQMELSTHHLSETVKNITQNDMLVKNRKRLHQTFEAIGKQKGIEKVRIINKSGEIIFSSDRSELDTEVDMDAEACDACHAADQPLVRLSVPERTRIFNTSANLRNLGMINPIYNEPSCWQSDCHAHEESQKVLGILDITLSLAEVDAQIEDNQVRMMIFAVGTILIVSGVLFFLVQHLVGKPVNQIVQATHRVAGGDLNYQIVTTTNDELGNLAQSFNQMTQKLSEAHRQLYQSDKLASIGRLAAGVAHEINNPLTGVLSYSSYLLKRIEDKESRDDLEVIVRETKRCREIVKNLLDFARPVPSKQGMSSLHDAMEHSLVILTSQLEKKHIVITRNFEENLPLIMADINHLQQLFINLILNAMDAIEDTQGEIILTSFTEASTTENYIVVQVSDSGCGIPHESIHKIFEPFYTSKGTKGTGLGLPIVWGIVEELKGTITVKSDVGKGTTFTIRIPSGSS